MIIKIVGANTINGIKLRQRIIDVVSKIDQKITINLLDDTENDGFLPILYINNHLISKGKVLSNKEIIKSIKNNLWYNIKGDKIWHQQLYIYV